MLFMQDNHIAILEWMALNTRRNNPYETKSATNRGPGLLQRLWFALRLGGSRINLKPEPLVRPPSVAVS